MSCPRAHSSGSARAPVAIWRFPRRGASSPEMQPASIAAAEQRVDQSRRELRGSVRRLGAGLARPVALLAAAAAGALVAFCLTRRAGAGVVASALSLYVRYRTEKAGA